MADLTLLSSQLTPGSAWFDESEHVYYFHDEAFPDEGDVLVSGSQIAQRYKPEFKRDVILNAISNKYGIPIEVIEKQWDLKREASLELGNAVHHAVELRGESYRTGGPVATCGQKYLESATAAFYDVESRKTEDCLHEQFVIAEELKVCGTIDRVVVHSWERKVLSIGDLKTNADLYKTNGWFLKPFDKLRNNPFSSYVVQLNAYAEIVEAAGWEVSDLDIFWLQHKDGLPVWVTVPVPRVSVLEHL